MDGAPVSGLGALPTGWTHDRFDSLFTIQQGKQVSKKARTGDGALRPFLRTKNVSWGALDLGELDEMYFSEQEEKRLALNYSDLLICEGGDIGRTAIWRNELVDCYYQNHLHRARVIDDSRIHIEFVLFWLWYAFKIGRVYFGRGNVTTIPNLSKSRLGELPIPLPKLSEQVGIAQTLQMVQRAIALQRALAEAATELKDALCSLIFTGGLDGGAPAASEIGPVPEGWQVAKLGQYLTTAQYGVTAKGSEVGEFPILRMTNQEAGRTTTRDLQYVTLSTAEVAKFRLERGDILFNRTNSHDLVGRTALFDVDGDYVFASYLIRLKVIEEELRPAFLVHYLCWEDAQHRLKGIAQRAVSQSNISATRLREFSIPVPEPAEQDRIVRILDALDAKIHLHQQRVEVLTELFESVLHQLMTGQVRVVSTQAATAELQEAHP